MPNDSNARESGIRQIEAVACKTKYAVDAFLFVLRAFPQNRIPEYKDRHITASELCWHLHDQAITEFGGRARERLADWAIHSCADFGNIVYALADASLLATNERDSRTDFQDVYEFENAFQRYANRLDTRRPMQWRLSTLFLATTVAAIAFAGFASSGFKGSVAAIYCSWLIILGVSCLVIGIVDRTKGWILAVAMGVIFTVLGLGGFLLVTISM